MIIENAIRTKYLETWYFWQNFPKQPENLSVKSLPIAFRLGAEFT
jgi:hypothetical protein